MGKKSSHTSCSVFGCNNHYRASPSRKISMYLFPNREWMKERKEKWIWFVKRQTQDGKPWRPAKYSRICSDHFIGGQKSEDPRSPSYNPTIFKPGLTTSNGKAKLDRFARAMRRNNVRKIPEESQSSSKMETEVEELNLFQKTTKYNNVGTQTNDDSIKYTKLQLFSTCLKDDGYETMISHAENEVIIDGCGDRFNTVYFGGYASIIRKEVIQNLITISFNAKNKR